MSADDFCNNIGKAFMQNMVSGMLPQSNQMGFQQQMAPAGFHGGGGGWQNNGQPPQWDGPRGNRGGQQNRGWNRDESYRGDRGTRDRPTMHDKIDSLIEKLTQGQATPAVSASIQPAQPTPQFAMMTPGPTPGLAGILSGQAAIMPPPPPPAMPDWLASLHAKMDAQAGQTQSALELAKEQAAKAEQIARSNGTKVHTLSTTLDEHVSTCDSRFNSLVETTEGLASQVSILSTKMKAPDWGKAVLEAEIRKLTRRVEQIAQHAAPAIARKRATQAVEVDKDEVDEGEDDDDTLLAEGAAAEEELAAAEATPATGRGARAGRQPASVPTNGGPGKRSKSGRATR